MNEPKIRFKGFEGEWKEKKLGEMTTSYSGGTPTAGYAEYYGGDIPFIRSGEIHEDKTELCLTITGYNASSAKMVEEGTILYALYGATSGDVAISKIKGAINQAVLAIIPTKDVESEFLAQFLQANKKAIVSELLQGGQGNLSGALVKNIDVQFSSTKEQKSIIDFLGNLDTLITTSASRLASLKQMKAASLQAMFPQEGETVPKIRFKGFEGEWEKVKFEEAFGFLKNNSLSRAELSDQGIVMNVHYGDVLIKYPDCLDVEKEEVTFVKDSSLANKLYGACPLQKGDVIFADAAEDNTVGKCTELVNCDGPIVSGLHTIPVRPLRNYASRYLGYYLNSPSYHNQLLVHIQGSKISSISKRALAQTLAVAPKTVAEQHAIASYFTSLDKQISLLSQRLEKLKQIKSACLGKMFV